MNKYPYFPSVFQTNIMKLSLLLNHLPVEASMVQQKIDKRPVKSFPSLCTFV
jgi:hypothetical protein